MACMHFQGSGQQAAVLNNKFGLSFLEWWPIFFLMHACGRQNHMSDLMVTKFLSKKKQIKELHWLRSIASFVVLLGWLAVHAWLIILCLEARSLRMDIELINQVQIWLDNIFCKCKADRHTYLYLKPFLYSYILPYSNIPLKREHAIPLYHFRSYTKY